MTEVDADTELVDDCVDDTEEPTDGDKVDVNDAEFVIVAESETLMVSVKVAVMDEVGRAVGVLLLLVVVVSREDAVSDAVKDGDDDSVLLQDTNDSDTDSVMVIDVVTDGDVVAD